MEEKSFSEIPIEKPKEDWVKIGALSLVSIFLLSGTFYAGYWLGSQQSKVEAPEPTIPTPTQALIPTSTSTLERLS